MYDLKELSRWVRLTDKGIKFPVKEPRKIRLEVLAENPVKLYVEDGKAKPVYIGSFEGYDVVQFNVTGDARLQADGAGALVWTGEFQDQIIEIPEAVSFTRMMTRRQRNPELEALQHRMQMNMERRLAQVQRDVTLQVAEERRALHAERERDRLERAREAEAEQVARSAENAGLDEPATQDNPEGAGGDVSGGSRKTKGQAVAPKPAAQG